MKCDFESCEAFIDHHGWLCKCLPLAFVFLLVGTTYYAYVVELCIMYIPEVDVKVAYLIFFHLTLAIFLVSYSAAKLAPYVEIPPDFRLTKDEFAEIREALFRDDRLSVQTVLRRRVEQFDLPICTRTDNGEVRFCVYCALIKPDRAHHCSSCNRCILRMDHHCIWIGTCVGFHNHKQFVLFLLYTLIFAVFVAATSTSNAYAIIYGGPESKHRASAVNSTALFPLNDVVSRPSIVAVVLLPVFSIAIGIGVTLLGVFQIWLVSQNRTGLEQLRKPMLGNGQSCAAPFDTKSCSANWISLFGSRYLLWLVPVFSSELDGVIYPTALNGSSRSVYRPVPNLEEAATDFV